MIWMMVTKKPRAKINVRTICQQLILQVYSIGVRRCHLLFKLQLESPQNWQVQNNDNHVKSKTCAGETIVKEHLVKAFSRELWVPLLCDLFWISMRNFDNHIGILTGIHTRHMMNVHIN